MGWLKKFRATDLWLHGHSTRNADPRNLPFRRSNLTDRVLLDSPFALLNNNAMTDQTIRAELLLGDAARGFVGTIKALKSGPDGSPSDALERQLVEMGFTEGARVEILHEGAISRDPIAVRIDNVTMALRRREALAVVVQ